VPIAAGHPIVMVILEDSGYDMLDPSTAMAHGKPVPCDWPCLTARGCEFDRAQSVATPSTGRLREPFSFPIGKGDERERNGRLPTSGFVNE
jgi:hypothetical protein